MKRDKFFTWQNLTLVLGCIILNLGLSKLGPFCAPQLYLDSIGTVLGAVLGGPLIGILVGLLSNFINALFDSINIYYAIISILIAVVTAHFGRVRVFQSIKLSLIAIVCLALIGGVLGGCLPGFSMV